MKTKLITQSEVGFRRPVPGECFITKGVSCVYLCIDSLQGRKALSSVPLIPDGAIFAVALYSGIIYWTHGNSNIKIVQPKNGEVEFFDFI